jgi:hypothetical protein
MPDAAAGQPAPTPPAAPKDVGEPTGEATQDKPVPPPPIDVPLAERRHPLRFVWQMDANGRFTLGSDEFAEVIGPRVAITLGRPWNEVNNGLMLDPEGQVARAVATHDTWSGITVSWPVDGIADRLKVELSGLPIYDRNRNFLGASASAATSIASPRSPRCDAPIMRPPRRRAHQMRRRTPLRMRRMRGRQRRRGRPPPMWCRSAARHRRRSRRRRC